MKCSTIIILQLYAKTNDWHMLALDDTLNDEVLNGGVALQAKVEGKGREQRVKKIALNVCDGTDQLDADAGGYQIPAATKQEIAEFVGTDQNVGVYLLAHFQTNNSGGELMPQMLPEEMGKLIANMDIPIRKLCVVACDFARKAGGPTGLVELCRGLEGMDEKPIVAGYNYPVFLTADGAKEIKHQRDKPKGEGMRMMNELREGEAELKAGQGQAGPGL